MKATRTTKRLAASILAVATVAGAHLIALPQAHAQAAAYVSFGDSVPANPKQFQIFASVLENETFDEVFQIPEVPENRCAQGEVNYPNFLSELTGLPVANFACSGSTGGEGRTGNNFRLQVDQALAENTLDASTQLVTVMFGFNDVYQQRWNPDLTLEDLKAGFVADMNAQIARVRQAAPNAHIQLVGYHELGDGQKNICPTNTFGVVSHVYMPMVPITQKITRELLQQIAAESNISFVDMSAGINAASNNNDCGTGERMLAAYLDDQPHNLWFHLTDAGSQYYAQRLFAEYAS